MSVTVTAQLEHRKVAFQDYSRNSVMIMLCYDYNRKN